MPHCPAQRPGFTPWRPSPGAGVARGASLACAAQAGGAARGARGAAPECPATHPPTSRTAGHTGSGARPRGTHGDWPGARTALPSKASRVLCAARWPRTSRELELAPVHNHYSHAGNAKTAAEDRDPSGRSSPPMTSPARCCSITNVDGSNITRRQTLVLRLDRVGPWIRSAANKAHRALCPSAVRSS